MFGVHWHGFFKQITEAWLGAVWAVAIYQWCRALVVSLDHQLLTNPESKDKTRLGIAMLIFNLLLFALCKLFNNKPERVLQNSVFYFSICNVRIRKWRHEAGYSIWNILPVRKLFFIPSKGGCDKERSKSFCLFACLSTSKLSDEGHLNFGTITKSKELCEFSMIKHIHRHCRGTLHQPSHLWLWKVCKIGTDRMVWMLWVVP